MVWKASEDLDEDKKQGEEGQPQASAGQVLSSPSASGNAAGGQAASKTTTPQSQRSSGSFTNLQSYIGANTGADKQMVGRVGNTVANAQDNARQAGSSLMDNSNTEITAGTVTDTKGITQTVKDAANSPGVTTDAQRSRPTADPSTPKEMRGTYNPATATGTTRQPQTTATPTEPPKQTLKDIDTKDFTTLYDAEYSGPGTVQDVTGYQDTNAAFGKVDEYGRLLSGDVSDRGTVLDDTFAKSGQQYTKGERVLDSFLLGAGSEAGTLQNIAQEAQGFGQNFNNIKELIGLNIEQGMDTTAATRKAIRDAAAGTQGTLEDKFASNLQTASNLTDAGTATFNKALKGDKQALKTYGFTDDQITFMLNPKNKVNLAKVLEGTVGYSLGDIAYGGDVSNYQTLMSLLSGTSADPNAKYTDFSKKGGNKTAAKAGAGEKVDAASALKTSIEGRLAEEQKKRDTEHATYSNAIQSYLGGPSAYSANPLAHVLPLAQLTGIDAETLAKAAEMGIDPTSFLTKGTALNYGDVATDEDRQSWNSLLSWLGIAPSGFDLTDSQDEGAAYTFNTDAFNSAIAAILAGNPIGGSYGGPQDVSKVLKDRLDEANKVVAAPIVAGAAVAQAPANEHKKLNPS